MDTILAVVVVIVALFVCVLINSLYSKKVQLELKKLEKGEGE